MKPKQDHQLPLVLQQAEKETLNRKVSINERQQKVNNKVEAGQVYITYYTDPLCCWSWAMEEHWQKLRQNFAAVVKYRYVMGGMIPDWNHYSDPMNSVSRPMQMGPMWMHASQITHVKMKYSIWHEDPPSSSYPACIAVKCAGLQSPKAEELYLFHLRKVLMDEGLNIAKRDVLLSVAEDVERELPNHFSIQQFENDLQKGNGKESFRADLQKTKYHNIGRFPTLTFVDQTGKGLMTVGYRPYEVLVQALEQMLK